MAGIRDFEETRKKLIQNNIILITSSLGPDEVTNIILTLMNKGNCSPKEEIKIYLTANTYQFLDSMAIYDVLTSISNPISVLCMGSVGGFATLFLAAATKGKRYALKHTTISFKQPLGSIGGGANQQTEVEIEAREAKRQREELEEILSAKFNKSLKEIHSILEDEKTLTSEEAKEFGLIDHIVE